MLEREKEGGEEEEEAEEEEDEESEEEEASWGWQMTRLTAHPCYTLTFLDDLCSRKVLLSLDWLKIEQLDCQFVLQYMQEP